MHNSRNRAIAAVSFLLLLFLASFVIAKGGAQPPAAESIPLLTLNNARSSPLDLEITGDFAGAPPGSTRYLPRESLLALPQVTYKVDDDANFRVPTEVSGVLLEVLATRLSAAPASDMVIALSKDLYRANYSRDYIAAHRPILVLKVNGQAPNKWPRDSEDHGFEMGPYLISHPKFVPSFRVLSLPEEPQIPWAVVRIEFRDEAKAFSAIAPQGPQSNVSEVQDGFRIARQHCFRCHNNGSEGGLKAHRSWQMLAVWAKASPEYFGAYVRNPKSKNPKALMPANPNYDDRVIQALIAYFREFQAQVKP